MAGVWWRNPWNFVRVLCVVSGVIASAVGVLQHLNPQTNLAVALAIPVALFTASFSASIGMWLYSYITQQAREASFRFERIYQPLYDELLKEINSLSICGLLSLHTWQYPISGSHLKEFVAPEVRQAFDDIVEEIGRYNKVWNEAHAVATAVLQSAAATLLPGDGDTMRQARQQVVERINQVYPYVFDPNVTSLDENVVRNIEQYIAQGGFQDSKRIAASLVESAKAALLKDATIKRRLITAEALSMKTERARKILLQRLMRPLS